MAETSVNERIAAGLSREFAQALHDTQVELDRQRAINHELADKLAAAELDLTRARDEQGDAVEQWRDALAARDAWKQVAEWLCTQMRGDNHA